MTLTFGFNVQPNLVGYAVVERDGDGDGGRILSVGLEPVDIVAGPARRRAARRYGLGRRRQARRLLAAHRLLPDQHTAEWRWLVADTGDLAHLRLRAARGEALARREFGRLLFQLVQHRRGEDLYIASGSAVRTGLSGRDSLPGPPGCREDLLKEFDVLWDSQAVHHDGLSAPGVRQSLKAALVPDSPHSWTPNRFPGQCPFVPGAPLCPKSTWLAREKQMLDKLNALSIVYPQDRRLSDPERTALLDALRARHFLSWNEVRDILGPIGQERRRKAREALENSAALSWDEAWRTLGEAGTVGRANSRTLIPPRFNFEEGGEAGLTANPVEVALQTAFGERWNRHPRRDEIRERVSGLLWEADYRANGNNRPIVRPVGERLALRRAAAQRFCREYGLSARRAEALAALEMSAGAEPFSAEALETILPQLERGIRFSTLLNTEEWKQWRRTVFPGQEDNAEDGRNRPADSFHLMCTLARSLSDRFGRPDRVRALFATELAMDPDPRIAEIARRRRIVQRNAAKDDLARNGIRKPSDNQIERWLLWVETGKRCPYTGATISFDALFGRTPRYNIDHIWPRSRVPSHRNSFNNKTLCGIEENEAKGNMTPWEYLGHDPARWATFRDRVNAMAAGGMPQEKLERFLAMDLVNHPVFKMAEPERYRSSIRKGMSRLTSVWKDGGPAVVVESVSSRVMSTLHRFWGFSRRLKTGSQDPDLLRPMTMAVVIAASRPDSKRVLGLYRHAPDTPRPAPGRDDASGDFGVSGVPPPWPDVVRDSFERITGPA